jgi:hypothetical protein
MHFEKTRKKARNTLARAWMPGNARRYAPFASRAILKDVLTLSLRLLRLAVAFAGSIPGRRPVFLASA